MEDVWLKVAEDFSDLPDLAEAIRMSVGRPGTRLIAKASRVRVQNSI